MPPPARSKVRISTGPSTTSASFSPAPMISPPTMAPGIEVKPPRMSTGSALSAINESENCTPSLAQHHTRHERDQPRHRPYDEPDPVERDADRLRRLVIVGDGAQGATNPCHLKEDRQHQHHDRADARGD